MLCYTLPHSVALGTLSIKPKVAIFWEGEEVATIDELPCLFEKTLDRPGTFDLRLKVSSLDVEFTREHMIEVTE